MEASRYSKIAKLKGDTALRSIPLHLFFQFFQCGTGSILFSAFLTGAGTFTNNLVMTQLVFYIAGTGASEAQNYLIRYDNIYVTKTANLEAAKAELAK